MTTLPLFRGLVLPLLVGISAAWTTEKTSSYANSKRVVGGKATTAQSPSPFSSLLFRAENAKRVSKATTTCLSFLSSSMSSPELSPASASTTTATPEVEEPQSSSSSAAVSSSSASSVVDWDWQALACQVFENDNTPIMLFDGLCNFCNGGVNLCIDWDQAEHHEAEALEQRDLSFFRFVQNFGSGETTSSSSSSDDQESMTTTTTTTTYTYRYASLQSRVGQSLLLQHNKAHDDWSSLVLVTSPEKAYFESDAVLRLAQGLPGLPKTVRALSFVARKVVPKFLRDMVYEIISTQRYNLGGHAEAEPSCRIDWDGTLSKRFVADPDETESQELQRMKITCTTQTEQQQQ